MPRRRDPRQNEPQAARPGGAAASDRRLSADPLTQDRIVAAAKESVRDHGAADFSLRELTRRLDVSVGAPYNHVAGRTELLGLVARSAHRDALALIGELPEDPFDAIRTAYLAFATEMAKYPGLAAEVAEHHEFGPVELQQIIREALTRAEFDREEAKSAEAALHFYGNGTFLTPASKRNTIASSPSMHAAFAAGLDMLITGIRAKHSSPSGSRA